MAKRFFFRKVWYFGKSIDSKSIKIEFDGFNHYPLIGFDVDGEDRKISFYFALFFFFHLSFLNFLSYKYLPKYHSRTYGYLPAKRKTNIRFLYGFCDISISWNIWNDDDSWSSSDPKWKHYWINFHPIFFGKHKCEFKPIETKTCKIEILENEIYEVKITKKLRIDSWPRLPSKKSFCYEASSVGIQVPGKGENSWDCGEDARSSMSFPDRGYKTLQDAAEFYKKSIVKDRERYGGKNWKPSNLKIHQRDSKINKIMD